MSSLRKKHYYGTLNIKKHPDDYRGGTCLSQVFLKSRNVKGIFSFTEFYEFGGIPLCVAEADGSSRRRGRVEDDIVSDNGSVAHLESSCRKVHDLRTNSAGTPPKLEVGITH